MGRPLEGKVISTLKPRIPEGLRTTLTEEFEKFYQEKLETEGLMITQTDFLNWIIVKFLKERLQINERERNNADRTSTSAK